MSVISGISAEGRMSTVMPMATAAVQGYDLRFGSFSNSVLGSFVVRREGTTLGQPQHLEFRAGRHVGSKTGYASVEAAVKALSYLTKDNSSSAAVVEADGRYWGYQLKFRDLNDTSGAPLQRPWLEGTSRLGEVVDFRTATRRPEVVAMVDGAFTHKFRG